MPMLMLGVNVAIKINVFLKSANTSIDEHQWLKLDVNRPLRFIYIRAKAKVMSSLQMGSQRMLLSIYIGEQERSKKILFSLSLSL